MAVRGQGQAGPEITATTTATGQGHQLGSEAVATGQAKDSLHTPALRMIQEHSQETHASHTGRVTTTSA